MKTNYDQKLKPVIRFLEQHYNTELSLKKVADMAMLSPYHFHRVFKAVTGETLNEYLRRLKLQQAAQDLFYKKPAIIEVALEYGFSSSQNFAKAFRRQFNLSPTDIRNCSSIELYSEVIKNSKTGNKLSKKRHKQSKAGNETPALNPYTAFIHYQRRTQMERKQFAAGSLAYIRVTGPYGENYEPAISKLYQWATAEGVADSTCIFIYHDNPELTPAAKCRTDICLMVPEHIKISGDIERQEFPGGEYGTIRKTITEKTQYGLAWNELISQIVELGIEMDDRPCFELYHSYDQEKEIADVTLCSAIK